MPSLHARNLNLQALVRTALQNRELAPGVAKRIEFFRSTILSTAEKRLLAVLDDAIADGFITIIEPATNQPAIQSTFTQSIYQNQLKAQLRG